MLSAWHHFAETFDDIKIDSLYNGQFKKNYFSAICDAIEQQKIDTDYVLNMPIGLFYIYSGNLNGAKTRLEKAIAKTTDDSRLSRLYGYLGNTHFLKGDERISRICYREAFEINPYVVDIDSIEDKIVVDLLNRVKKEISDTSNIPNNEYLDWVATYGCIETIFPFKIIKILDDLRVYVKDFIKMEKVYRNDKNKDDDTGKLKAILFYKCIVLSESNQYLKNIKDVELIKVRVLMKEINPSLFKRYMKLKEDKVCRWWN
ncbi:MAG: hypothetical protein HQK89_05350 [Nitrospirae bacterium]|nr:hypothetical protein [Nitrospirota bacterium]